MNNKKLQIGLVLCFCLVLIGHSGFSQSDTHVSGKAKWMDFWIGSWNLTWEDKDGNVDRGLNEVKKTMDGNVIQENFKALTGKMSGFKGKSWTVFNANRDTWYQTWVDNKGSYLDFTFELDGAKRIFKRSVKQKDGTSLYQRMVFYNIKENDFDWDWETSIDAKSWKLQWRIHYERIISENKN